MRFGTQLLFKSVQACHLAALVAWKAKQNGDKVGGLVLTPDKLFEAKPRSRQKALLHWLNNLVEGHQTMESPNTLNQVDAEQKFEQACSHLRRVAHPGSLVYIISDFLNVNDASRQHLFQLQKHCEVNACAIYDPLEQALPNITGAGLSVTDGQENKTITSSGQVSAYNQQAQHFFNEQKTSLQKLNIKWLPISAGLPLQEQL